MADYETLYAGDYMKQRWEWRASGLDRIGAGQRVLEVGAGRGDLARKMLALGHEWTACDAHPTTGDVERMALPSLRYADHAFDYTVTVDVLEHIHPDVIAMSMRELRRVAPRGLWAVANMSDVVIINGDSVELHLIQKPAEWWQRAIEEIGGSAVIHHTETPQRFWLEVA